MNFRWDNVIKNQAQGYDPLSAYYKEQERVQRQRSEEHRKLVEKQKKPKKESYEKE